MTDPNDKMTVNEHGYRRYCLTCRWHAWTYLPSRETEEILDLRHEIESPHCGDKPMPDPDDYDD